MIIKTKTRQIANASDIAGILHKILASESEIDQDKEHFWTIGLTTTNGIKYVELVTLGLLDQSLAHPREIFRLAVMQAVKSVIIAHNHPSGNVQPSQADIRSTKQIQEAGEILGIKVLDHVIVGNNGDYYSFHDAGRV